MRTRRAFERGILAAATVAGAMLPWGCVRAGGSSHGLFESEPNDDACCADDFGWVGPGSFLAIRGHITDDGFDPYDGFAFVATEPVTVEFRLFIDDPFADLDVCVYDPYFDVFVDCFESPFNPEVGELLVLEGGTEFHLVIDSFVGSSSYTLELEVFPLFATTGDGGGPPAAIGSAPGARLLAEGGEGHGKPDRTAAFRGYRTDGAADPMDDLEPPAVIEVRRFLELELESGETRTATFALTSEGAWYRMGMPTEAEAGGGP